MPACHMSYSFWQTVSLYQTLPPPAPPTSQWDPRTACKKPFKSTTLAHLQCSHTGFEKPHETALKLVYRAENRCKSIGARAGGIFQALLGPIWARKGPQTYIFRSKKKPKSPFDCIGGILCVSHHGKRFAPLSDDRTKISVLFGCLGRLLASC